MATSVTVTPGITANSATRVTAAVINAAANPTVSIADGSIPAVALDLPDLISEVGDAFRNTNWLPWGTFHYENFAGTQPVVCADGLRTENVKGWFVLPTGNAVNSARSERTSSNEDLEGGRAGLQVFGATSLTFLRVGTYLPPGLAALLYGGDLTFSVYVWNNTGASITPALEVSTSNTDGDEGTVTLRDTVAGTACTNSAWTRVEFTMDASALTNWPNGVRLGLKFTVAGGQLDNASDYVIIADAQIDKDATVATEYLEQPPPPPGTFPAGTMFPYAGATAPAGWLLCDGTAVSRTIYARLFQAISTAHGVGDGSTTFNLPDGRGRTFAGAEVAGASQSRLEVSMTATGTLAQYTLTVTSTAGLRTGMGAYGTGIGSGAYITDLTPTVITLSAAHTAGISSGTVRFGKLGASADPETVGAAGDGMSYGRNAVTLTKMGCSTATSTTLTVPNLTGLACGMSVSGTGIPAGCTIDAFLTLTTVRLSAAATGTASGLTMTFGVDAPEGNQWERYQYLLKNPKIPIIVSTAADSTLETPSDLNSLLETGMSVSCTNASAGIQANTYITSIDLGDGEDFGISPATSGAVAATYDMTFSSASMARTSTPVPDTLPAFLANWIIKT